MVASTSKYTYEYLSLQKFYNAFKPITTLHHVFEVPTVSLKFSGRPDQELMQIKGLGFMQDVAAKNIFVGTPAASSLSSIARFGPEDDRIRPGHIGFDAYVAYVYLMKGAHIFTSILAQRNGKMKTTNFMLDDSKIVKVGEKKPIRNLAGDSEDFENKAASSISPDIHDIQYAAPNKSFQSFPGSFIQLKTFKGPIDTGVFFPYFTGMCLPDKVTAHHVFENLFFRLLSDTEEGALKMMSQIRAGIKQLAFSRSGIILSHLYKGIEMAAKIPASKMTVVLDGATYHGFIITGKFKVALYGETFIPVDVMKQLKRINKFTDDCELIAAKLNSATDAQGSKVYNFTKETFMRSRSAIEAIYSIDKDLFTSTSTLEEVITLLVGLKYSDAFPVPSIESIRQMTTAMLTQTHAPLQNFPAYFDEIMLKNLSPIYIALSAFGPKVPSCNIAQKAKGGVSFTIPRRDAPDANIERVDGKRPLQYIPYEMVPIHQAAVQYESLFSTGVLTLSPPRKNKREFTNLQNVIVQVGDDKNFSDIYTAYKEIVSNRRLEAQSGGKRKRDGGDASPRKKSRQEHEKMADEY